MTLKSNEFCQVIKIDEIIKKGNDKFDKSFIFNPSLAWICDDLFLTAFRIFKRYDSGIDRNDINNTSHPDHPWLGGNKSSTWWKIKDGMDQTYLCILKLKENKFYLHQLFEDKINGVDARIFRKSETDYILTYNTTVKTSDKNKNNQSCEEGCFIISQLDIGLTRRDNKFQLDKHETTEGLCLNLSNFVEKNWSYLQIEDDSETADNVKLTENTFAILYQLTPSIEVFGYKKNMRDGCFSIVNHNPPNFLNDLERFYSKSGEKRLFVSLSTPAYPLEISGRYLSVGHIKFKIHADYKDTPLQHFLKKHQTKLNHPIFIYVMFLFQFRVRKVMDQHEQDKIQIEITKISNAFLIENEKHNYNLNFPSGLAYHQPEDQWFISYGDGDRESKVLKMSSRNIKSLLIPVHEFNTHNYKFGILTRDGFKF